MEALYATNRAMCGTNDLRRATLCLVTERVRSNFREMPGLSVTLDQAARLFGVPWDRCASVLMGLVDEGFLRQGPDGRYVRRAE